MSGRKALGGLSSALLLAVDTCGASGSIALGRVAEDGIALVGESLLAGGEYASTLVSAVADLLDGAGISVGGLAGMVVVVGPGSFTGIRIGLAAVKAFAEARALPVVTVSRLALLAWKAESELGFSVRSAVLDAHRGQVFCGLYGDGELREMLLTAGEVNAMGGLPLPVAVCEEAVAQLVETLLEAEPVRVASPTAGDALRFSLGRWTAGEFADVATLDGYYLRGADAKVSAR